MSVVFLTCAYIVYTIGIIPLLYHIGMDALPVQDVLVDLFCMVVYGLVGSVFLYNGLTRIKEEKTEESLDK